MKNNPYGLPLSDFSLTISDPPPCTVGFLPPSQWRHRPTPPPSTHQMGCTASCPRIHRSACAAPATIPCMGHPGKRAPTVELCNDPKGYQPLAIRQHYLGPYPIDPNLIAQGVPPDDRVDFQDRIYAPLEGTPLPPGAVPAGTPPDPLMAPITPHRRRRPAAAATGEFAQRAPIPPAEAPIAPAAGEVPPAAEGTPHGPGPCRRCRPVTVPSLRLQVPSAATVLAAHPSRSRIMTRRRANTSHPTVRCSS